MGLYAQARTDPMRTAYGQRAVCLPGRRIPESGGSLIGAWGRRGLNPGPAGSGSKPLLGIMQRFTLAA